VAAQGEIGSGVWCDCAQVNDEREARRPMARRGLLGALDSWPGMQRWPRGRVARGRMGGLPRRGPLPGRGVHRGQGRRRAPRSRLGPQRRRLGHPYAGPGSGRHVGARPRTRARAPVLQLCVAVQFYFVYLFSKLRNSKNRQLS
jgi:hypothetical protein